MKKIIALIVLAFTTLVAQCQPINPQDTSVDQVYRGSSTKINDLVHTKLEVKFDYDKSYLYGKEWVTLKPHFYDTDSLTLDAKGMDIKEVAIVKDAGTTKLKYTYDSLQLRIQLGKTYKAGENYTIYISYTSKPNEVKEHGSAAINDAKGLYFINPKGLIKNKPTEIWTQGETEANSVWMPTIDKPDQKSTEEITMTVPDKYVTLSNGLLISQQKNADGTRTDYWKMDLPHAPYLFFMGVGDYAIIHDTYKDKNVDYYVEKPYAPYARSIFGHTPEMIGFYEKILGVPFQWQKYDQIVGADYVSGAMENTTATLHQESAYQNARELVDGNSWETVICHELFHQWFGDLVTCESWSNITVNESMADYSQTLWTEYKYGKDAGDEENDKGLTEYLSSPDDSKKDLVRFYYNDKEDVFDLVSYQKGGRVLNMLRNYVGDSAFFKSLNLYLVTNKFKTGEAHQLRLAFEEITGQDLNWFWNQWYYGNGHPKLDISYVYDDKAGKAQVIVQQTQETNKIFTLPIAIDVYNGVNKTRTKVWIQNKIDTFTFNYTKRPDLINVDADKILLCEKTDNKTADNFIFQMKYAPNYLDRKEALEYFAKNGLKELTLGLTDKYPGLRKYTIDQLIDSKYAKDADVIKSIENIASNEKDKKTQADAIKFLAQLDDSKYLPLFQQYVDDSSYSVAGGALQGLRLLEPAQSYALAKKYSADAKGTLGEVVTAVFIDNGSENDYDYIFNRYSTAPVGQEKFNMSGGFCQYLSKINDTTKIKNGIDEVIKFAKQIPDQYRTFTDPALKASLRKISAAKGSDISNYIDSQWNK
jgi:aminopeptidase N